jgi:response regulator RpfG family c-di-GMP phosphodiesterase
MLIVWKIMRTEPLITVLLIDPNRHILHLMEANLHHAGYRVLTAWNDIEARAIENIEQPDLVVHLDETGRRVLEKFLGKHPPQHNNRRGG